MRRQDILFPLFIFLLMSSSVYALEFYTPEEIQGLSYVSVFEYAQNTTDPAWWDFAGWFGTGNESDYFSAWDFDFNSSNNVWIATTEGLDFTSPIDEVQLTIHPLVESTYGKFRFYDPDGDANPEIIPYWFGLSAEIQPNKEVIIYVSYSVNNTTYLDTGNTVLFVYDNTTGEQLFRNNTLPTTAGTIHNITGIIPADIYNNQNARAYIGFWFEDLETPVEIIIYEFKIFTFDESEPFIADNFTTGYAQDQCNTSDTPITATYSNLGIQVSVFNETQGYKDNACGVYLFNNVSYTRRLQYYLYDLTGCSGSPPTGAEHFIYIARDMGYTEACASFGSNVYDRVLFTQITTNQIKAWIIGNYSYVTPQIQFSDSGSVNYSIFIPTCFNTYGNTSECSYDLTASGDQYRITMAQYGNTDWLDTYSKSYCPPSYACTFGTLYFTNADCSNTEILPCGIWDCNSEGDGCNYPTNPENASETVSDYGSYCFEENSYSYYILNSTGIFVSSCTFPDECRQLTDITTGCMTQEEYDDSLLTSGAFPDRIAYTVSDMFGLDVVIGKLLFILILGIVGAWYVTKDKPNSQDVQLGVMGAVFVVGFFINFVPFEVFMLVILLVLGLYYRHYKDMGNKGD